MRGSFGAPPPELFLQTLRKLLGSAAVRSARLTGALLAVASILLLVPTAQAATPKGAAKGTQRITYKVGPLNVTPGQNRIAYAPIREKPQVDGWITRIRPDLTRPRRLRAPHRQGHVPPRRVGEHVRRQRHLVACPSSSSPRARRRRSRSSRRASATATRPSDRWLLNHMIHNLTPQRMRLYITYTVDFIPDTAKAAKSIQPRPPDLDGRRRTAASTRSSTSSRAAARTASSPTRTSSKGAYPRRRQEATTGRLTAMGCWSSTAGHVHTGRAVHRHVARARRARAMPGRAARSARRRRGVACRKAAAPSVRGNQAHLFKSTAKYLEPAGPVSWDVRMTATRAGLAGGAQEGRHARDLHHL